MIFDDVIVELGLCREKGKSEKKIRYISHWLVIVFIIAATEF